tara:strand:+ start:694 stop:837 length:144 start_codon:yes stop_codon:yes gene_type:complete
VNEREKEEKKKEEKKKEEVFARLLVSPPSDILWLGDRRCNAIEKLLF